VREKVRDIETEK
jgi:hypothetical protein